MNLSNMALNRKNILKTRHFYSIDIQNLKHMWKSYSSYTSRFNILRSNFFHSGKDKNPLYFKGK